MPTTGPNMAIPTGLKSGLVQFVYVRSVVSIMVCFKSVGEALVRTQKQNRSQYSTNITSFCSNSYAPFCSNSYRPIVVTRTLLF